MGDEAALFNVETYDSICACINAFKVSHSVIPEHQ